MRRQAYEPTRHGDGAMAEKTSLITGDPSCFSPQQIASVWPECGPREESALLDVLHSGLWCRLKDRNWQTGPTGRFEAAFREFLNAPEFLTVTNGTVAIELALATLGVEWGDEILTQAGTFFGTVTPILRRRAVPVFVDIDANTCCFDPESVESRISPRTKGVIIAHLSGLSPDMDRLLEICRCHGLWLIEDCAQAIGTEWHGKKLGTFGDFGTFSFQQDKPLTSGEGGGLACNRPELLGTLFAHHQGFDVPGCPKFDRTQVSTNARLSAFQGALLGAQLERLPSQIERRLAGRARVASLLRDDDPVELVEPLAGVTHWSISSVPFRLRHSHVNGLSRNELLAALCSEGVPGFEGHLEPLYWRPLYRDNPGLPHINPGCPITERVSRQDYFSIMQWFFLGPLEWMDTLVSLLRKAVANAEQIKCRIGKVSAA